MPPAPRTRRPRPAAPRHGGGATARRTAGARRRSRGACRRRHGGTAPPPGPAWRSRRRPACAATSGPSRSPTPLDPGADRHGEALLRRERLGRREVLRQPLPQQPLAGVALHLQRIRQAEGGRRDAGIEERRAALHAMRHQAAVELDQQVVRQPVARRRAPAPPAAGCGRAEAAAASAAPMPSRQPAAARAARPAGRSCHARAAPCRPATRAASPRDSGRSRRRARRRPRRTAPPSPPARAPLRQVPGRQDGVVGGRVVHGGDDLRQVAPDIRLGDGTVTCCAPAAAARRAAAWPRSSAAPAQSKPAVKASTGRSFSRAISASTAALSMPPDRNMP